MSEKEILEREFKATQLQPPEFKERAFGKVDYDFSTPGYQSLFSKDIF